MPDFNIRSLQFENANTVDFTTSSNFTLLGVNDDNNKFARVNVDLLFSSTFRNGDGIVFTVDAVNKYTTISRDYTTEELTKLNQIDIYLKNMIVSDCTYSGCYGGCIATAASPSACNSDCTAGCNSTSIGATTCTLSNCVASCMAVGTMVT